MNKMFPCIVLASIILAGCSTHSTMYKWGEYEETLVVAYSYDSELKEEAVDNYLQLLNEAPGEAVIAPGMFAEAGTFMLERGNIESATEFYKMEYEAWPESRPMLKALIDNLENRL